MLTTHLSIQVLVFVLFFNITEIQARRGGGFRANFGGGGGKYVHYFRGLSFENVQTAKSKGSSKPLLAN